MLPLLVVTTGASFVFERLMSRVAVLLASAGLPVSVAWNETVFVPDGLSLTFS